MFEEYELETIRELVLERARNEVFSIHPKIKEIFDTIVEKIESRNDGKFVVFGNFRETSKKESLLKDPKNYKRWRPKVELELLEKIEFLEADIAKIMQEHRERLKELGIAHGKVVKKLKGLIIFLERKVENLKPLEKKVEKLEEENKFIKDGFDLAVVGIENKLHDLGEMKLLEQLREVIDSIKYKHSKAVNNTEKVYKSII